MKKIILLFILTLFLVSCGEECQTKECFDYKLEQEKLQNETKEKARLFELEKLKIQAEIEKSKPVEVKVQELKNETQSEANASLNYLETSQKVRDGIDIARMGYGVFKILSE